MDCIYHGCFRKNVDDANRIIGPNETCLVPNSKLCWEYIEDVPGDVKTHSQYKKQRLGKVREFDTYFQNKNKEDIERWESALDSEVRILKPTDHIYIT